MTVASSLVLVIETLCWRRLTAGRRQGLGMARVAEVGPGSPGVDSKHRQAQRADKGAQDQDGTILRHTHASAVTKHQADGLGKQLKQFQIEGDSGQGGSDCTAAMPCT